MNAKTLFELVARAAERTPDKPVVSGHGGALDYASLVSGARGVAAALAEVGVGPGHRVGVWMDKSPRCVQALLGILASGAAYVAMDPRSPTPRCNLIARDAQLTAVVLDATRSPHAAQLLANVPCRLVLADGDALPESGPFARAARLADALALPPRPLPRTDEADLAYILYTSGSTGTPKGVVHTHASALAFVDWVVRTFQIVPGDVFSSHAPFHFDLSISDLYASLGSGASVRLISSVEAMTAPWLVRNITAWGVTVWYSVPSILISMLDQGQLEQLGMPTVRTLLFAGEVFPTPQLRRLRRAVPHADLCNLYGPTETNVCTWYRVPAGLAPGSDAPIPIGAACDHMETFALDDQGREVEQGLEGTLWVRGGNLMQGYWNDPVKTAATLRPDPRGTGGLVYCTGDRVRQRPDGGYDFLGRRDHQIKTRGYRVELGEIESAVTAQPDVLEAAAWALPDPKLGNRIVLSVVPAARAKLEPNQIRARCAERLPSYMVPDVVEVREALPRTSTGKADRGLLRAEWEGKRGGS